MKHFNKVLILLLSASLTLINLPITTNAAPYSYTELTNAPDIVAASAIVMEVNSGAILYEKNMNDQRYPASITKIMTALLAAENSSLDEIVEFSHEAVYSIEIGSSNIAIDEGEKMTMEHCLYGMLLESANEVANAIGEHVGGTLEEFINMMNEKAVELGCTGTHFTNTNGLPDTEHYVTAHDMALIASACFKNEIFMKIAGTRSYVIPPTADQPDEIPLNNNHKMLAGRAYEYDGVLAGKTGYTDAAGNTLVTLAERNGVQVAVVVLGTNKAGQWADTAALLDYTFANYQYFNIADNEESLNLSVSSFFTDTNNIFGSDDFSFSLDTSSGIVLPISAAFTDASSELVYDSSEDTDSIGVIQYTYNDQIIGSASINVSTSASTNSIIDTRKLYSAADDTDNSTTGESISDDDNTDDDNGSIFSKIFSNILVIIALSVAAVCFGIHIVLTYIRRTRSKGRKRRKK